MPRLAPVIREATPSDADLLLQLWAETTRTGEADDQARRDAVQALANTAADPEAMLLVAEGDDRIVAALFLARGPISPLSLDHAVHTSYLVVAPSHRRHGYAHALMEAAVSWAEEKGVEQMSAFTDGSRETNRFLARLGLGTVATVRLASTAALRKKLSVERARSAAGSNRHLVEVLAQRRTARRRQAGA
ncbi:hypothetical protein ASG49_15805 [Marmoricola sp. Leaf446]|nr:hypothetical protein ASG49_15805 [Marmoricola sp. Leaf446]